MSNTIDDLDNVSIDQEDNFPDQVPQMINVLTILTFIGSGLSFITYLGLYFMIPFIKSTNEKNMELIQNSDRPQNEFLDGVIESGQAAMEYMEEIYLMNVIVAIFCIIAAIMMRKLKKTGYYLYVLATLVYMIFPFVLLGFGLASIGYILSVLIGTTFIILYGVNLKHLK